MLRKLNISMVIAAFSLAGCLGGGGGLGHRHRHRHRHRNRRPDADARRRASGSAAARPPAAWVTRSITTTTATRPIRSPCSSASRTTGAPEISTRMHSCQKMKYAIVGNVLTQLGVNMGATGATSAAVLYKNGAQAMGAPNYGARVAEAIELSDRRARPSCSTSSCRRRRRSSPPFRTWRRRAARPSSMFDASGHMHVGRHRLLARRAGDAGADRPVQQHPQRRLRRAQIGQTLAVATLLSAAHTCE